MNIKNYTSSVSVEKSILHIENILIEIGARNIAKEYSPEGKVCQISFSIPYGESIVPYKLPAKQDPIKKLFLKQYSRPTGVQIKNCEDQAERTAWRNLKEWVELQATMIKLEQVEFMEVFMPYMYNLNHGKTLFQLSKENNFKQLTQ